MGRDYVKYCVKQLHEDDQELAARYLNPLLVANDGGQQEEEKK
jgi:hypothetical protein